MRTARDFCGIPIYFYSTRKRVAFGNAAGDAFFEDGCLYVGPYDACRGGVLHEVCHYIIAEAAGKLGGTNYDADDDDEVLTCELEVWLGFVTGFYSYNYLVEKLFEYNLTDTLDFLDLPPHVMRRVQSNWVTAASVEKFLLDCRRTGTQFALARKIARVLEVWARRSIHDRIPSHKRP